MTKQQDKGTADPFEDWITTAEAAEMLGLTQRRVRQLLDEGELEFRKVTPRLVMVYKPSIENYLQGKSQEK